MVISLRTRTTTRISASFLGLCAWLFATDTHAGILDKVKDAVGDVAETGWRAATAPAETVINAGRVVVGDARPEAILKPYNDMVNSAGNAVQGAATLNPQALLIQEVQRLGAKAGPAGEFAVDLGTFTHQFYNQLAVSGGQALVNTLKGQNPLHVAAAPLAAAIRAARERHLPNARPLPDDVVNGLRPFIDGATLARAKYAVGKVEITLPAFIGRGARFMGNGFAVVVDDVIVFNEAPPAFAANPSWWGHEVTHVAQYGRWGVEAFAYNYVKDLGDAIEGEAKNVGSAVARSVSGGTGGLHLSSGSMSVASGANQSHALRSTLDASARPSQQAEVFVAQCFFPADPYPVSYLVTNFGKIIAVDLTTGMWMHIGFATPPRLSGVAWSYDTSILDYAVMPGGEIMTPAPVLDQFGFTIGSRMVQIGHVVRL